MRVFGFSFDRHAHASLATTANNCRSGRGGSRHPGRPNGGGESADSR